MLIGGVAVIAHGVRRLTDDVDAAIWGEGLDLKLVLRHLAKEGIKPRIADATEFARQTQVLLLRHTASGIDVDLSLAWLPFESAALDRANTIIMGKVRVRVARPDALIVYKAIAARERDRSDVERLLELHDASIDLAAVRKTVRQLATALGSPELAENLDAIVRKVSSKRTKPPRGRTRPRRRK